MSMSRTRPVPGRQSRRGVYIPLVALSLVVVMGAIAVALNRIWIDTTHTELLKAAESSALAAARSLANDDLLRTRVNHEARNQQARQIAVEIGARNLVAGDPLFLDGTGDEDIQFGKLVRNSETGRHQFLQVQEFPTTVVVNAHRTQSGNNPVAMFLGELYGSPTANVSVSAEASLENQIRGVRPIPGGLIPALPLAIQQQIWEVQSRTGVDLLGWDEQNQRVSTVPDGIPEIHVVSKMPESDTMAATVHLVDLGTDFHMEALHQQMIHGLSAEDLKDYNGELTFDQGPISARSLAVFTHPVQTALRSTIGQARIALLYGTMIPSGNNGFGRVTCPTLVSVRVLQIIPVGSNACEIVLQPSVVATRTALLANSSEQQTPRNPYIYKLHLTQ